MRGNGGHGQRRPYNRRDEPVTSVSLNPKQRERQVRGHAEVGRESQKEIESYDQILLGHG